MIDIAFMFDLWVYETVHKMESQVTTEKYSLLRKT